MKWSILTRTFFLSRLVGVAAFLFVGCASTAIQPVVAPPGSIATPASENSWWYVRFRVQLPEQSDPAWHTDLLIAEQIVKPALERHAQDIALWRFHRRAARDEAGHQFSFIFFAPAGTAFRVFSEISAHPVLELAQASGRITAVLCDDPASVSRPGIGGTSDPAWSEPLRQAWPYYIMGASQMWLDLVSQLARNVGPTDDAPSFERLDARYATVSTAMTMLWQNEGRHAFLHHLNAIFGYESILIIEKRHMRF
jgi:hypothetical protein